MKWQARSKWSKADIRYRRRHFKERWHSAFAWTPKRIPETKHEEIVVPCHYVWLEKYELRFYPEPQYRSYQGTPTLEEMARAP